MLTITESHDGGTLRLALDGELDLSNHGDLTQALDRAWTGEAIVIDCGHLRFCDSTGIYTFLQARDRAQSSGVSIRLTAVNGLVQRVLGVCGALPLLTADAA